MDERICSLLGVCVCVYFPHFSHSREDSFFRALYLFQVKNRSTPFVLESVISSCVGLFVGVSLFFPCSSLSRGRFRSLGWKACKGVPVCSWEEWSVTINRVRCWNDFTFFKSGTWSAFFPVPHCREDFFAWTLYLLQTKIGALCLCLRCLISELRNFIGWCCLIYFSRAAPDTHMARQCGWTENWWSKTQFCTTHSTVESRQSLLQHRNPKVPFLMSVQDIVRVFDGLEEENVSPLVVLLSEGRVVLIYWVFVFPGWLEGGHKSGWFSK